MIDIGIVYGSKEQAQPIIFGYDTIYVHENIQPCSEEGTFSYNEKQYTYKEYIAIMEQQRKEDREFFEQFIRELKTQNSK